MSPQCALLNYVICRLFGIIDADSNGRVSKDELIDACLMYDERVPIEGIEDTFEAVESFSGGNGGTGLGYDLSTSLYLHS